MIYTLNNDNDEDFENMDSSTFDTDMDDVMRIAFEEENKADNDSDMEDVFGMNK